MDYQAFVNKVCDDGIKAAQHSYRRAEQMLKRQGAEDGFNLARETIDDRDLRMVLETVRRDREDARRRNDPRYWYWRCREAEVEWVANVVSAARWASGASVIVPPTYRGLAKADEVMKSVQRRI